MIAIGSLLGVSFNYEQHSFPVGKVQFMDLYQMDFEEFLMATNHPFITKNMIALDTCTVYTHRVNVIIINSKR